MKRLFSFFKNDEWDEGFQAGYEHGTQEAEEYFRQVAQGQRIANPKCPKCHNLDKHAFSVESSYGAQEVAMGYNDWDWDAYPYNWTTTVRCSKCDHEDAPQQFWFLN
jgi:hypothetical protein